MKKIILILVLVVGLFAQSEVKFYEPSFSCSKVKKGSIEYKICTDENLANLDKELSTYYKDAKLINKNVKQSQRKWIKERNTCKDTTCIKSKYISRVELLEKDVKVFSDKLLIARDKAYKQYTKTKNVYPSIDILKKAGIKKILNTKPDNLTNKQYSKLLENYSLYHIYTAEDMMHGENLHLAINLLQKIKILTPNDADMHLLQARAYLKLFRFSIFTSLISSRAFNYKYAKDPSYKTIASKMKKVYMKYVKLAKKQNLKINLTSEENYIVKRQRVFIDWYTTFKAKKSWVPVLSVSKSKKGFENICKEYVNMLNHMPDNNLTECSRYVNVDESGFEYISYENAPDNYKYGQETIEGSIFTHLLKYKNKYFLDQYSALYLAKTFKKEAEENVCKYMLVDFNKPWKNNFTTCNQISNYKEKYPNNKYTPGVESPLLK